MSAILLGSTVLRAAATVWTLLIGWHRQDRRILLFAALLALMTAGQVTELVAEPIRSSASHFELRHLLGLLTSLLAIFISFRLQRAKGVEQRTDADLGLRDFALASSSNGIVIADARQDDLPVIYCNPAFERMTGYSQPEVLGRNCRFLQGDDRQQPQRQAIRMALKTGQEITTTLRNYRKDGALFWSELRISPICDKQGTVTHFIGFQNDVSERIRAEHQLRESEARFRALAEHSYDVINMFAASGELIYASPSVERVLGFTPEEMAALHPFEVIHPDDVELADAEFRDYLEKPGAVGRFTHRLRHKDGSYRTVEVTGTNLLNEPGVNAMVSIFRDISERDRAEQALKTSESIQRSIMASSLDSIMLLDRDQKIQFINRTAPGLNPADVIGTPICDFLAEDAQPRVRECMDQVLATGVADGYVVDYVQADGAISTWEARVAPVRTDDEVSGLTVIARDITQRRQAENQLRESERRFRAIFNSTFQFIGLLDTDGKVLEANETVLEFGGVTAEEVLRKPFWEAFWWRGDAGRVRQLRDAIKRAAAGEFVRYTVDVEGANSIETVDFSIKPVIDDQGHVKLLVPEGRVVTEQKRAEELLRANEKRFRRVVEHAPEAVVLFDVATNRFAMVNPAAERMFQLSAAELCRQSPFLISPPRQPNGECSKEAAQAVIARARAGETPFFEWTHRDSTGRDFPCEIRLLSLELDGRTVVRGSITDITDRKLAEQALRQGEERLRALNATLEQRVADRTAKLEETNAELAAFAYTVSHDLRAPLRAMEGFAIALSEDYGEQLDEQGHQFIQHIVDSAKRMDQLVDDLLTYSRLGRAELRCNEVALSDVMKEAIQQLGSDISTAKAQIEIADPLFSVHGHKATLVQAVTNLLANGMKFVAPGVRPRIKVWAEATDDENVVRLWIQDNGIGIEDEYHSRVFRVFERLHGIESYPGTGIGLAIVARACRRLNGRCGVDSNLGQGSRFWVELPKAHPDAASR